MAQYKDGDVLILKNEEVLGLEQIAKRIRIAAIDMLGNLGVGHMGGVMSLVEVLTVLYYRVMNVDVSNPQWRERDRLVLSKGHAGPALYATLADKGFFPKEWLHTLNRGGTKLPSHCDMNKTPGIDMTTGSLGQGISAAIGIALANHLDEIAAYTYLIIGDGESDEGQIWEGALAAAHYKLGKLIAFTDNNKLQIDGPVCEIMNIEDIGAKWSAFGWHVERVNGHDLAAIAQAINKAKLQNGQPSMIVLDTIKGKGCHFCEGAVESHNLPVTKELAAESIRRLQEAC